MRVVVVFGGETPQHEVSLCGAREVLECAAYLGWEVFPVGVSRSGAWVCGAGALSGLWRAARADYLPKESSPMDPVPGEGRPVQALASPPGLGAFAGYDFGFPVTHGRWGEDGTLQALLRSWGLMIIGSGAEASALCFDKHLTKAALAGAGIPVAAGVAVPRGTPTDVVERQGREALGPFPWFVKPARGGSSLGIARVDSVDDLAAALQGAFRWDDAALVEECVPHRELVLGIVGRTGGDLVVSPAGECMPVGDLYTYEEKYRLGNPRFTCPAPIDDTIARRAADLALRAFQTLGCDVFARVDLFLNTRTQDLVVNEVNTIPGLTEVSVFPRIMRAAGLDYPTLLSHLGRVTSRR